VAEVVHDCFALGVEQFFVGHDVNFGDKFHGGRFEWFELFERFERFELQLKILKLFKRLKPFYDAKTLFFKKTELKM
jgi:hypothetical protein